MSTQPPHPPAQTDTVKTSSDIYGLGRSGGQRGAEILAGLRAISTPTPETKALSTMMGRLITRTLLSMVRNKGGVNLVFARSKTIEDRIREELQANATFTHIELASGLAPRTLTLAREFPQATIIDLDQPDVIQAKQERVRSSALPLPDNLKFVSMDLGTEDLPTMLGQVNADSIAAEGLTMYLEQEQLTFLLSNIYRTLKPNGLLVCDVQSAKGVAEVMEHGGRIFARQAGQYKLNFKDEETLRARFDAEGFTSIRVYRPSDTAKAQKLPLPVIDAVWVVSCRRKADA